MRKLRTLGTLPVDQAGRLLVAWVGLLLFDLALRATSVPRIQAFIRAATAKDAGEARIEGWLWAVDVAARHHLYPMRCLQRSLTLQFFLSRIGQPTELKIGVRKEGRELEAHAWLEVEGRPLGEPSGTIRRYDILNAVGAGR